jgi:hypothetical protein
VRTSFILLLALVAGVANAAADASSAETVESRAEIQSGIVVTPQPALVNQRIDFRAMATGPAPLAFKWFIGGLELPFMDVFASYKEPGPFIARLQVTDSAQQTAEKLFRVYVTSPTFDADLDGVPSELETALGSNPNDVNSKNVELLRERLVFTPKATKITADPNKVGNDSISGSFLWQRSTTAPPARITLMISGVLKSFDVTGSGRRFIATPSSGSKNDKLTLKQKDNNLTGNFSFKKGTFLTDVNRLAIVTVTGTTVINVYTVLDTELYGLNINLAVKTSSSGKVTASGKAEGEIPGRR